MKDYFSSILFAAMSLVVLSAAGETACTRTQAFELERGWNAIFLEVQPDADTPAAVFGGAPVDIAAAYLPPVASVQFIRNPAEEPWNEPGWAVWYASSRPESVLSNLQAVRVNRPYLVHATAAATLSVTGRAAPQVVVWRPNSFNFVGFSLDAVAPPTFTEFFAGSAAHADARFFRLVNDRWRKVAAPETTRMRPGEACWIYCRGRSAHQGPVSVTNTGGVSGIDFGQEGDLAKVYLFNVGKLPAAIHLEQSPQGAVPLAIVETDRPGLDAGIQALTRTGVSFELEPGAKRSVHLHCRREKMTADVQEGLLALTVDTGQFYLIPVRVER